MPDESSSGYFYAPKGDRKSRFCPLLHEGRWNAMTREEGIREMTYQMVMRASWKMLQSGLLSEDEYLEFEGKMREKYRPVIGLLFSDIDLLSCG